MWRPFFPVIIAIFLAQACQYFPSSKPPGPPSDPPPSTSPPSSPTDVFADRVISYQPVGGQGWPFTVNPAWATGAPGGPQDTVPLGFDPNSAAARGGNMVLGLGSAGTPYCIEDGPGADFVIYSSAVPVVDPVQGPGTLNQVMFVAVSDSGAVWYEFPYAVDSSKPLVSPARYQGLAGVNATVGTGVGAQGGDAYDLSALSGLPPGFEACYVRITDAGTVVLDYGSTQPDPYYEGGAVDAIRAINSIAQPGIAP